MDKPLRIVLVITGLKAGGAETMLLNLLQNLDRRLFEPTVISLTTMGDIGPKILDLNIPVITLGINPSAPNPLGIFRLISLFRRLRPALVHTWMYHSDLLGGVASRLAGIKALAWGIRHTDLSLSANKRLTLLVVYSCAYLSRWLPKKITANSKVACKVHASVGYVAGKIIVIPNGFDLERFSPSITAASAIRNELGLRHSTPLVGVIGRFHAQKNQLGFVQAMAELHAKRPDVHFLFAGYGVDSSNGVLVTAIQSLQLAQVCHLLGPRTDMPTLIAALDVLALPSKGEAFPNVVGEAMACGVPCAVTDVGDSAWIVGETGRIVSRGDMPALARAILDLLDMQPSERSQLGALARERVACLFDIRCIAKQYEAFYLALAEGKV